MCWVCEEHIDNSHWACHYKTGLHTHTINTHKSYHKPDLFEERLSLMNLTVIKETLIS